MKSDCMNTAMRSANAVFFAFVFAFFLAGCDDNKNNVTLLTGQNTTKKIDRAVTVGGQISDEKGPVELAAIEVVDSGGRVVVSTQLRDKGRYSIEIPAGVSYPVELKAYAGGDRKSENALVSVIIDPNVKTYDINPGTTAIAKKAKSLGGYTPANMMYAAMSGIAAPDANKTTAGFRGDPTKQYGGWH